MSRDIFVQDLPPHVRSLQDIPDDWRPNELPFGPAAVRAAVHDLVRDADFSDPLWGRVSLVGAEIEVSIGGGDPLNSFALHVRAQDQSAADAFITQLLARLGVRAVDPEGARRTGIFGNG